MVHYSFYQLWITCHHLERLAVFVYWNMDKIKCSTFLFFLLFLANLSHRLHSCCYLLMKCFGIRSTFLALSKRHLRSIWDATFFCELTLGFYAASTNNREKRCKIRERFHFVTAKLDSPSGTITKIFCPSYSARNECPSGKFSGASTIAWVGMLSPSNKGSFIPSACVIQF